MRSRHRILSNIESQYRDAFEEASNADDKVRMSKLDFAFQRDQLLFEVLLDIRDALAGSGGPDESGSTLLDKAEQLRKLTRLR